MLLFFRKVRQMHIPLTSDFLPLTSFLYFPSFPNKKPEIHAKFYIPPVDPGREMLYNISCEQNTTV